MSAEYVCLTKMRLSAFWTLMLRNHPADFERVYAETTSFEHKGMQLSRQYLVEAGATGLLEIEMRHAGLEYEPIDPDEIYSKYEATPPDWMWIEH